MSGFTIQTATPNAPRQRGTMDDIIGQVKHLQSMITEIDSCSSRVHDVSVALYGARPEEASDTPTPGGDSVQSILARMQLSVNQLSRRVSELEGNNRN
jgi:hypothetical protein